MPNYIVAGVPRSGKSTLAKILSAEFGLSVISGDALVSSFMNVLPGSGITHYGDSHAANCEALEPFLREYLRQMEQEQIPYVLDIYHLLPSSLAVLRESHRICVLGYPEVDPGRKLASMRSQEGELDWTVDLSDAQLLELVHRFIAESRALQKECAALDIPFVDTAREGAVALDTALAVFGEDDPTSRSR